LLSWKYLNSMLVSFGAPKEQLSLVVLLIGLGVGSLIGQLVYFIFSMIWDFIAEFRNTKKAAKERELANAAKKEKEDAENELFLENFKKAFRHYIYWKKDELRKLTKEEQCLESEYEHVQSLKNNNYIIKVSNVDSEKDIYKINPIIQQYVAEHWAEEIDRNLNDFFDEMSPEKEELLHILDMDQYHSTENIKQVTISFVRSIHPCITIENEDQHGFYLSFRYPYCSLFSERYGKDLAGELYISYDRVVS